MAQVSGTWMQDRSSGACADLVSVLACGRRRSLAAPFVRSVLVLLRSLAQGSGDSSGRIGRSRKFVTLFLMPVLWAFFFWAHTVEARLVPVGPQFQVNTYTPGDQLRPQVVASPDGGFIVVWEGPPAEGGIRSRLSAFARRFDSAGAAVGPEFQLEGVHGTRSVAMQGDSLVVAWFGNQGLTVGRFGADGSLQASHPVDDVHFRGEISLAAGPEGELGLAWNSLGLTEDDIIRAQRFGTDGETLGPSFVVTEVDPQNGYPHYPKLAVGPDNSFIVVWWAEPSSRLWGQRFDANDQPAGGRFPVVEPPDLGDLISSGVCVNETSGNFVVRWVGYSQDTKGRYRRFTPDAEPLTGYRCAGVAEDIACLSGERIVTAGGAASGASLQPFIATRAFDQHDRLIGHIQLPLFPMSRGSFSRASTTRVLGLNADTFVVVWDDCAEGESGCDVFGQRLTLLPAAQCTGDCDGDGRVTVDELLTGVGIALGRLVYGVNQCGAMDTDSDCVVSIGELVQAVNRLQRGCD